MLKLRLYLNQLFVYVKLDRDFSWCFCLLLLLRIQSEFEVGLKVVSEVIGVTNILKECRISWIKI